MKFIEDVISTNSEIYKGLCFCLVSSIQQITDYLKLKFNGDFDIKEEDIEEGIKAVKYTISYDDYELKLLFTLKTREHLYLIAKIESF